VTSAAASPPFAARAQALSPLGISPLTARFPLSTAALWVCIALFFARVVGQIEVLLLEPAWLPGMPAWYSGLLPYPLLLPIQIALLMLMSVLAFQVTRQPAVARHPGWSKRLRVLALLYFTVMALRLVLTVRFYGADFYLHGAIPIAFHWVLALYLLLWARLRLTHAEMGELPLFV
jgi:hypothetical protein